MEAVASGLATFDYDKDGCVDIYFLNGAPLRGTTPFTKRRATRCIATKATGKFRDITRLAAWATLALGWESQLPITTAMGSRTCS
jgi:enediyne biosynthesis protein E4